jgi:[ribosomal protein S5]-alanine N-acetyltransferase
MINVSTSRMLIRNFFPDDWRELQQIILDKEASKYAFSDYPLPTSEREVKEMTNWFSQGDSFLAVYEKADKKIIGYIAINSEKQFEYNLGYCLHSDYQNKGYATEACIAVVNYVFSNLNAEKFVTGTAVSNEPSCKMLTKLGFTKTGESVTSFRKDEEGKPIEFTGASFELTRDTWNQTKIYKSRSR